MNTNSQQSGQPVVAAQTTATSSASPTTSTQCSSTKRSWLAPTLLLVALGVVGVSLAAWKANATQKSNAAAAQQPEPMEVVTVAVYKEADAADLNKLKVAQAIKSETGKKSGKLTVDVPENTATRVVVGDSPAKTSVKVRVTNR